MGVRMVLNGAVKQRRFSLGGVLLEALFRDEARLRLSATFSVIAAQAAIQPVVDPPRSGSPALAGMTAWLLLGCQEWKRTVR